MKVGSLFQKCAFPRSFSVNNDVCVLLVSLLIILQETELHLINIHTTERWRSSLSNSPSEVLYYMNTEPHIPMIDQRLWMQMQTYITYICNDHWNTVDVVNKMLKLLVLSVSWRLCFVGIITIVEKSLFYINISRLYVPMNGGNKAQYELLKSFIALTLLINGHFMINSD